jgi:predicted phage-related endonuclease
MMQVQTSVHRRSFIGGSDARIIMGDDEPPCSASGGKSAAKPSPRTYPATSSSSAT